jgi:hypothetical protein
MARPNAPCHGRGKVRANKAGSELRNTMRKTATIGLGVISAVLLSACGGGWGNQNVPAPPAPPPTPVTDAQGFYSGMDSLNDNVTGVVLDSGTYYFVWANTISGAFGLVQGTATAASGKFSSTDAKNYTMGTSTVVSSTVSAVYTAKSNITGTITPASGTNGYTSFSGTYSAVYEQTPNLSAIAGSYQGAFGTLNSTDATVTVTLNSTGGMVGNGASGCRFSGTAKPHANGNVYDLTLTFGAAPCSDAGQSMTGVLLVNNGKLVVATTLADRSDAFVLAAAAAQ